MLLLLFMIYHSMALPFRTAKYVHVPIFSTTGSRQQRLKIKNTKFRYAFLPRASERSIRYNISHSHSFEVSYLSGLSGKTVEFNQDTSLSGPHLRLKKLWFRNRLSEKSANTFGRKGVINCTVTCSFIINLNFDSHSQALIQTLMLLKL